MGENSNIDRARERKRRYRERLKIAKYGLDAAGQDMRGRHGNHARGEKNARWNNGQMRTSHGYIAVRVPEGHHLRQAHGYAYEHDLIAEALIGRRLRSDEVVHHINGIRSDNRPENLQVETRREHARKHVSIPGARDSLGRFTPAPRIRDRKGGDPSEWPEDLRVRQFPETREAARP